MKRFDDKNMVDAQCMGHYGDITREMIQRANIIAEVNVEYLTNVEHDEQRLCQHSAVEQSGWDGITLIHKEGQELSEWWEVIERLQRSANQ